MGISRVVVTVVDDSKESQCALPKWCTDMNARQFKTWLKRQLRWTFVVGQKLGVNILPNHFYSQIPDIRALKSDSYWREAMSMCAVPGASSQEQLAWLSELMTGDLIENLPDLSVHDNAVARNTEDGGYGFIESEVLFAFIVKHRPGRVIQIGCGVSTAVLLRAAEHAGYEIEVACIDPYPTEYLKDLHGEGTVRLFETPAQKVDLGLFDTLRANDFLFVDSTHTVKPGSEVNRLILEVLPRLGRGVWVHFHDINFPYDYKRDVLDGDLFFWSEGSLLHAFLAMNTAYVIRASMSMLHYDYCAQLQELLPTFRPQANDGGLRADGGEHFPSSIYLQRIA